LPHHVGLVTGHVRLPRGVRHGEEGQAVAGDALELGGEAVPRVDAGQVVVRGQGLGGGLQEAVQRVRAGQLGLCFLGQGLHELLLSADAPGIGAVADAVAGPDVAEGLLVSDGLAAGLQVQVGLLVMDGLLRTDLAGVGSTVLMVQAAASVTSPLVPPIANASLILEW
jgi:hypothetical protein